MNRAEASQSTYAVDVCLDNFEEEAAFCYDRLLPGLAAPGLTRELNAAADHGQRLWEAHQQGDTELVEEFELGAYLVI